MSKDKPPIVVVMQNETARCEAGEGVATLYLNSCYGLLFRTKDKVSFTHVSSLSDVDALVKGELAYVGKKPQVLVFKGERTEPGQLETLKRTLKKHGVAVTQTYQTKNRSVLCHEDKITYPKLFRNSTGAGVQRYKSDLKDECSVFRACGDLTFCACPVPLYARDAYYGMLNETATGKCRYLVAYENGRWKLNKQLLVLPDYLGKLMDALQMVFATNSMLAVMKRDLITEHVKRQFPGAMHVLLACSIEMWLEWQQEHALNAAAAMLVEGPRTVAFTSDVSNFSVEEFASAVIVVDATRVTAKDNTVTIDYEDGRQRFITFKKHCKRVTGLTTDCSPYELQDVLHSLHVLPEGHNFANNFLAQLIAALKDTDLEIRELGEIDQLYRKTCRVAVQLNDINMLKMHQARHRTCEHVRNQMKLPTLRVPGSTDITYYAGLDVGDADYFMPCYLASFPPDLAARDKVDFVAFVRDSAAAYLYPKKPEHFAKRCAEALAIVTEMAGDMNGRKLMDVGCGLGDITQAMQQKWPEADIIGVEPDAADVVKARARNVHVLQCGVQDVLTAKGGMEAHYAQYDVVTSFMFLIPPDVREQALDTMAKLLKPDGKLVIGCMDAQFYDPENRGCNDSLTPVLERYFGVVTKQPKRQHGGNRYVITAEAPKHVKRYKAADFNAGKKALIERNSGRVLGNPAEGGMYELEIGNCHLRSKNKGGIREALGIARRGMQGDKQKAFLAAHPDVTVEPHPKDVDGKNRWFQVTYPETLEPLMDNVKANFGAMQTLALCVQAAARGMAVRKAANHGRDEELVLKKRIAEIRKARRKRLLGDDAVQEVSAVTAVDEAVGLEM